MLFFRKRFWALIILAPLFFSGCAATTSSEYARTVNDPLEPMNRVTFAFNQVVDTLIVKPAAMVYETVVPEIMRDCIWNVLTNIYTPVSAINHALQGDFEKAGDSVGRFMTNTVYGLGGVIDVASMIDIPKETTGFGMTLAKWGIEEGPYLVLPLLGPSSFRGAVGIGGDFLMNPLNVAYFISNSSDLATVEWVRGGTEVVAARAKALPLTDDLERNSLDLYVATRSMYLQNRAFAEQKVRKVEKLDYDYDFDSYVD